MEMNPTERLKLQEMIKANNVEDQTNRIRELKHSQLIRQDISTYLQLTQKYPGSHTKEFFKQTCLKNCNFLFTNYTDIYNKMIKNELNLNIMMHFVDVLYDIEEGKMDQHEGSYKVGKILKELYIDTALRKEEKLEARAGGKKSKKATAPNTGKKLTYAQFKHQQQSE
jgi:hypothetical protein